MKINSAWQTVRNHGRWLFLLTACATLIGVAPSDGAERKFWVALANSPKEFPNPDRDPLGMPSGGLVSFAEVGARYFDHNDPLLGSFAEYWKEISYGDVTVAGDVEDWISLPWAIRPPLEDPALDDPEEGPPDEALRISPEDYLDFDQNGTYSYGMGEPFDQGIASIIIDPDGDPGGVENGPFVPVPGLGLDDFTSANLAMGSTTGSMKEVWTPGERFIDLDGDGRFNCLDESMNLMDCNQDGQVDLLTRWCDLNGDDLADFDDTCELMPDVLPRYTSCLGGANHGIACGDAADCPDGDCVEAAPWATGDDPFNYDCVPDCAECQCIFPDDEDCDPMCTAANLGKPLVDVGADDDFGKFLCPSIANDCNGNGILDADDIFDMTSEDTKNWACLEDVEDPPPCEPDGIPDECQCIGTPICVLIEGAEDDFGDLPGRCEFHDNGDGDLDVTEPFEDFLRRWDPCLEDSDATVSTGQHWIKTYDPHSTAVLTCEEPAFGYSADYASPDYLENNYPGDEVALIRRAGNGMYDPSDSWTELGSTKMQWAANAGGPRYVGATPEPGTWPDTGPFDEAWYPQAWADRYDPAGNLRAACESGCTTDCQTECGLDEDCQAACPGDCEASCGVVYNPAPWPAGTTDDPQPPLYDPSQTNVPRMVPFSVFELDEDDEPTDDVVRRFFQANRGGLNQDGTGTLANPLEIYETGFFDEPGGGCTACPILPEEVDGVDEAGIYYDGVVEHDDLPSSKYHLSYTLYTPPFYPFGAGDERLGEVTSPFNDEIWGHDLGNGTAGSSGLSADGFIVAAGPYAKSVHGNGGFDAGNMLLLEWMTWRTDGTSLSFGDPWEWVHGTGHPFAGVGNPPLDPNMNVGFRDYNLDGLIDQGEVRPAGSENYLVDGFAGSLNDGVGTVYPFNRQRLMEDVVAILDHFTDFDPYEDANGMFAVTGQSEVVNPIDLNMNFLLDPGELVPVKGYVSGIVLLAPGSHVGGDFNEAPTFYPIHNDDEDDPESMILNDQLSYNLKFHDLVIQTDATGSEGGGIGDFSDLQVGYSAHEYLHAWEQYPDLYDYDVYHPCNCQVINFPIGRWCIMASGGLVHPVPRLKEFSGWIEPIDLATVLTPGVPQEITLPTCEFLRDETYYFFQNPFRPGERFYFWHVSDGDVPLDSQGNPLDPFVNVVSFDATMPGEGMLILHMDENANDEAAPSQQTNGTSWTYAIVAADGLDEGPAGTNSGDAGDPWPGSTGNFGPWDRDSTPDSRWLFSDISGISFNLITPVIGGSRVEFLWNPTDVPTLQFLDPPGGETVNFIFQVRYEAVDQYGGTEMEFFYTQEDDDYTSGTSIGTMQKPPGVIEDSLDWNVQNLPDGVYRLFAKLSPGEGEDLCDDPDDPDCDIPGSPDCDQVACSESAFSIARAGRNNFGEGILTIEGVDSATVKLESWTVELVLDEENNPVWEVTGGLSDLQMNNPTAGIHYTTDGNEVTFLIEGGGVPFAVGDRFVFLTTGLTAFSDSVQVVDGSIEAKPTAVIRVLDDFPPEGEDVIPAGQAPLELVFDAQDSTDPNNENLTYSWAFGDGTPDASGETVLHTFFADDTFTVTLTATNVSGSFDQAAVDVLVINQTPSAIFLATPTSGPNDELDVHFDARLSSDPEDGLEGLSFEWNFGDCPEPGCTVGDSETQGEFQETDHFYSTNNPPEIFYAMLTVTDTGGATDTYTVAIMVGNTNPLAAISVSNTTVEVGEIVLLSGSSSFDPDGDPITFSWDFGDGTPDESGENVSHVYTDSNTYTVTLTVSDGLGGEGTAQVLIFVLPEGSLPSPAPNAAFSVVPSTTVDLGTELTFISTSTPAGEIISWDWSFGDGTADETGEIVSHTYDEAGSFLVTLTVEDVNGNDDFATQNITVVDPEDIEDPDEEIEEGNDFVPVASFTAVPTTGPAPLTVAFDASASSDEDGDTLTYSWDYDDGDADTGVTVEHAFTTAGAYNVVLTVDDGRGRSDDVTMLINVLSAPSSGADPVARIATGPRSGPVPLTINFAGSLSSGDNLTYQWTIVRSVDGSTEALMDGAVVSYTFTVAGTYEVTLTVTDDLGRSDSSATETVTANQATVPGSGEPDVGSGVPDGGSGGFNIGRPTSLCGAGMLMGMFASAVGLVGTLLSQRRRRL